VKDKGRTENILDEEWVEFFNHASSIQEKLQYFSMIQDEKCKIELLRSIPENEKYKFLGKLKNPENIAQQLNKLGDEKSKKKSLNFIAKQLKGNSKGLLSILQFIDFKVILPEKMLTFNLNSLNDISMEAMINLQEHVENSFDMKFTINEKDAEEITYSFAEMSAIISKIEELTAGIPEDLDELEKFITIYYRMINNITYNHNTINKSKEVINEHENKRWLTDKEKELFGKKMAEIRRNSAGLYGGLVEGKSICVGYATILQEALKKVGIKSMIVTGVTTADILQGKAVRSGHAWNQVQINGKWYNADSTWDAEQLKRTGGLAFMLRGDSTFCHGEYSVDKSKIHICKKDWEPDQARFMKIVNQNRWWGGIGSGR